MSSRRKATSHENTKKITAILHDQNPTIPYFELILQHVLKRSKKGQS